VTGSFVPILQPPTERDDYNIRTGIAPLNYFDEDALRGPMKTSCFGPVPYRMACRMSNPEATGGTHVGLNLDGLKCTSVMCFVHACLRRSSPVV
jgi:hypothetical protein